MRATKLCLVRECCSKCKTFGITSNDIKCCSSCTARCQMLQQLRVALGGSSSSSSSSKRSQRIRHAHKARPGQTESASSSPLWLPSIDFQSTLPLIAAQCLIKQSVSEKLALHLACLSVCLRLFPSSFGLVANSWQYVAKSDLSLPPFMPSVGLRLCQLFGYCSFCHTHIHTRGHTYTVALCTMPHIANYLLRQLALLLAATKPLNSTCNKTKSQSRESKLNSLNNC